MTKIRSKYDPIPSVDVKVEGKSLTQQNFAEESDINNITARHLRQPGRNLGNIAPGGTRQPIFGDFTGLDYHHMLNKVQEIDNIFARLPGKTKSQFRNNPELFINFVNDPANVKECLKKGWIAPPEGMVVTEEGNLVEQGDIVKEAAKAPAGAPPTPPPPEGAPKADPEAQPPYNGGKK